MKNEESKPNSSSREASNKKRKICQLVEEFTVISSITNQGNFEDDNKQSSSSSLQISNDDCIVREENNKRQAVVECDCIKLQRKVFRNFRSACEYYRYPGSFQVGSYGPKGKGILRSYSNATPHKDKVLGLDGNVVMYRLKPSLRTRFLINQRDDVKVRVFRKVGHGVMDLGLYTVNGIVPAGKNDRIDQFGNEFVHFVRA